MTQMFHSQAECIQGIPKRMQDMRQQQTCSQMFLSVLLTPVKTWKQVKCSSTDECGIFI